MTISNFNVFVALTAILLAIDLCVLWGTYRAGKSYFRAKRTLTTMRRVASSTIANATLNEVAHLAGTAREIDDTTFATAGLSGARCLWWSVKISESNHSTITLVGKASGACDFHLDDGSDALALIRMTANTSVAVSTRTLHVDEACAKAMLASLNIDKEPSDLLFFEHRIDAGQEVSVVGHATAFKTDTDRKNDGPFRGSARTVRLVIESRENEGERESMTVSVGNEAAMKAEVESKVATQKLLFGVLIGLAIALLSFSVFVIKP